MALLALLGAVQLGMQARWFRPPYPPPGRALAWWLGTPGAAYHFEEVVPGHLYRSGRPDQRLVEHVRATRGVTHLVGLSGPLPVHEVARSLGMQVTVFRWAGDHAPPDEELEAVLRILDEPGPVWVHCEHGISRTGAAIAAYRVTRQAWSADRALDEMEALGHDPIVRAALHAELRSQLEALGGG